MCSFSSMDEESGNPWQKSLEYHTLLPLGCSPLDAPLCYFLLIHLPQSLKLHNKERARKHITRPKPYQTLVLHSFPVPSAGLAGA